MIGPIGDYTQIYVAACGEDFINRSQGVRHEKECPHCQAAIYGMTHEGDDTQDQE